MSRPVGKVFGVWTLSVPAPLIRELGRQSALKHGNDVFAEHWEELPTMKIAACCDVKALSRGVR